MNERDAWKGFNVMMGGTTQQHRVKCPDPVKFVNGMNTFYARFDDKDFRNECADLCQSLDPSAVTMCEDDVVSVLSHVNTRKAPRPRWSEGKGFESMYRSVRKCFYSPVPAFVGYSVCSVFMAVIHHYTCT